MTVNAMVAIAETEHTFPIQFDSEPQIGEELTLTVDEVPRKYVVVDVDPTGFSNSAPYLFGVYVRPKS